MTWKIILKCMLLAVRARACGVCVCVCVCVWATLINLSLHWAQ